MTPYSYDHLESVWYYSEPSEGPVTGQELLFVVSYSQPALLIKGLLKEQILLLLQPKSGGVGAIASPFSLPPVSDGSADM